MKSNSTRHAQKLMPLGGFGLVHLVLSTSLNTPLKPYNQVIKPIWLPCYLFLLLRPAGGKLTVHGYHPVTHDVPVSLQCSLSKIQSKTPTGRRQQPGNCCCCCDWLRLCVARSCCCCCRKLITSGLLSSDWGKQRQQQQIIHFIRYKDYLSSSAFVGKRAPCANM